ncbi:ribokinase [Sinomonas sp. R1AF57]|uniref:ribokinase n=1 Tax=Sinomonas sp. R1AF57 TaxID=2020377 RepID=UPI000B6215BB|nr:ribokinase [Sinomonas sp. R1AF57]ASN50832.1 ribokinase [Sinomonas sp. R1AF57]
MAAVVVVGSLNADLTVYCRRLPAPGETIAGTATEVGPGGKGANQAVAASLSGAGVALVGAVGDDSNGAMLRHAVTGAGVDARHVRTFADQASGMAIITVDDAAENTIVTTAGANGRLSAQDVAEAGEVFRGARAVCLCLEVPREAVLAAALAGREAGATVILNASPFGPLASELLAAVDVLLVNAHEASQLLAGAPLPPASADDAAWAPIARGLTEVGAARAVVTLGAGGAVVLEGERGGAGRAGVERVPALPVEPVDTTGAGDAFAGALAARLAAGDSLGDAARYAAVASALSTTARGAQRSYPTREKVVSQQLPQTTKGGRPRLP